MIHCCKLLEPQLPVHYGAMIGSPLRQSSGCGLQDALTTAEPPINWNIVVSVKSMDAATAGSTQNSSIAQRLAAQPSSPVAIQCQLADSQCMYPRESKPEPAFMWIEPVFP
jgi:hypothetical protein